MLENRKTYTRCMLNHIGPQFLSVLLPINMSLCLIYVFLCQSYLFDEDVTRMKRGIPEGILLLQMRFEGIFFPKTRAFFLLFFLNKSTVVVPQEAVVYVMFLHFWNFCQLHVKFIRSKYIHAKKMYLWMFYVISSLKPG